MLYHSTNLYEEVLIKPAYDGANGLKIISGYATSAMAFHHLEHLLALNKEINISLLVGMCPLNGLSISNHKGFQTIANLEFPKNFSCSYIFQAPAVHSKLYIWYKNNSFYKAYIGSANYTQNAFLNKQREILLETSNQNVESYYSLIEKDSIYCTHNDVENLIQIFSTKNYSNNYTIRGQDNELHTTEHGNSQVTISLLSSRTGDIQNVGGLNWGQREGRNPNQAYIQLPPDVYKSDFFPLRSQHFTVVTDDSKLFICTRAQKDQNGQAIETPHNNSLLGEYFRNRLGLPNGAFIKKSDLERYGRTNVTFYKIDNENYVMDFSV